MPCMGPNLPWYEKQAEKALQEIFEKLEKEYEISLLSEEDKDKLKKQLENATSEISLMNRLHLNREINDTKEVEEQKEIVVEAIKKIFLIQGCHNF